MHSCVTACVPRVAQLCYSLDHTMVNDAYITIIIVLSLNENISVISVQ